MDTCHTSNQTTQWESWKKKSPEIFIQKKHGIMNYTTWKYWSKEKEQTQHKFGLTTKHLMRKQLKHIAVTDPTCKDQTAKVTEPFHMSYGTQWTHEAASPFQTACENSIKAVLTIN